MKIIHIIATGMLLLAATLSCKNNSDNKEAVRIAVEELTTRYPKATLQDIYKSFFQDRFGPGHLISDTTAANKYLLSELESTDIQSDILYEPTGYQGNFYRVNLSIIKDGIVPYKTYFDAFVRSANAVKLMSFEAWTEEWESVLSVIETMDLELNHYQEDKLKISTLIQNGEYVLHHSQDFSQAYKPHYRIIEKNIFEKEILPLIDIADK